MADVRALVERCIAPLYPLEAQAEVSDDEMHALDARARAELSLPEGIFYNGLGYLDWDGNSTQWHPGIQPLVDELRASKNKGIDARNARVGAEHEAAKAAVRVWCSAA
mmetsp:Transcript_17883/g.46249  ORF Transcript_17883/g.46249 Transcript_17883/m.46249 type:complete len:108 (+) Transcript_17883:594-917(+)